MEIQVAVVHHKWLNNLIFTQEERAVILLFNDTFLNRNDENWPHTLQTEIAG